MKKLLKWLGIVIAAVILIEFAVRLIGSREIRHKKRTSSDFNDGSEDVSYFLITIRQKFARKRTKKCRFLPLYRGRYAQLDSAAGCYGERLAQRFREAWLCQPTFPVIDT